MPNQSLELDCETASLFAAAQLQRWRGRFAPRHRAADYHPPDGLCSAPTIRRMQQTIPSTNTLASGLAADPQRIMEADKKDLYPCLQY